ncbi:MAG: hypothetical protein AAF968_20965 [Pseudomonadota bacterium]
MPWLLPILDVLVALRLMTACSSAGPEQTKSYGEGMFVQGETCCPMSRR